MDGEAPRLTIRVGQDVFDEVEDYVVLVRTKKNNINTILSRTSSYCWAHGAMEATIAVIHQHNIDCARGDSGAGEMEAEE